MNAIRIKAVPAGFAPEHIREQWVGTVIPLPTPEEVAQDPPTTFGLGAPGRDGPLVLRDKAIEALWQSGREEAARFWSNPDLRVGRFLQFKPEVCEVVES